MVFDGCSTTYLAQWFCALFSLILLMWSSFSAAPHQALTTLMQIRRSLKSSAAWAFRVTPAINSTQWWKVKRRICQSGWNFRFHNFAFFDQYQTQTKQVKPGFTTYQPRRQLNFKVTGTLLFDQVTWKFWIFWRFEVFEILNFLLKMFWRIRFKKKLRFFKHF